MSSGLIQRIVAACCLVLMLFHQRAAAQQPVSLSTNDAIQWLQSGNSEQRMQAIAQVTGTPGAFLYKAFPALAMALVNDGRKDEAFLWWYFGYIRACTEIISSPNSDEVSEGALIALSALKFTYSNLAGPEFLGSKPNQFIDHEWQIMILVVRSRRRMMDVAFVLAKRCAMGAD